MARRRDEALRRLAAGGIQPRGLCLEEAAAYVGMSAHTFHQEVTAGTMPAPMNLRRRHRSWDRLALDRAMDAAQGLVAGEVPSLADDL